MDLGIQWGYWGQPVPKDFIALAIEAERAGYDAVWTAPSWGSDAPGPLVLLAGKTDRIRLGSAVAQTPDSPPSAWASHAVALDHISDGRLILGLGVSAPEGLGDSHGVSFRWPLVRTQECVEVLRRAFRHEGRSRREVPIWIGAEGLENVRQACDVAEGWFPAYYSPWRAEVYHDQIRNRPVGFEICVNALFKLHADVEEALGAARRSLALGLGALGAEGESHHAQLMGQMGLEREANLIQELLSEGRRDEAIASVPTEFADEISLVGSVDRIKDRLQAWDESAVTMINVAPRSVEEVWQIAEIVKGQ